MESASSPEGGGDPKWARSSSREGPILASPDSADASHGYARPPAEAVASTGEKESVPRPQSLPGQWPDKALPASSRTLRMRLLGIVGATVIVIGSAGGLLGLKLNTTHRATSELAGTPTRLIAATAKVANVTAVATVVDPAIVDINTTLAGNEGTAAGTGMIITSDGDILTNNHVVEDAVSIKVTIFGRGTYSAKIVGTDVAADLAVIKLNGLTRLTTVRFDTSAVAVGTSVVAIGNALGKGGTPSAVSGTVSALDQTISAESESGDIETLHALIETDARIEPGDSGGPLLNAEGEVVGMDTAASTSGRSTSSTAFAIPVSTIIPVVEKMLEGKSGDGVILGNTAFLGIAAFGSGDTRGPGTPIGSNSPRSAGSGVVVQEVMAGSPAAEAGLMVGDVITKFDGTTVTSENQLKDLITTRRPGSTVRVTYTNGSGISSTLELQLVAGPVA